MALLDTRGLPRQLLDILRLLPQLDDLEIVRYRGAIRVRNTPDTQRTRAQGSLRGKLTLDSSGARNYY